MKKYFTKKRIIIYSVIALVVVIIIINIVNSNKNKFEYTTVEAIKKELIQTVSETGTIKPVRDVDLSFLASGTLDELLVETGDNVIDGQELAKLNIDDLLIRRDDAAANLVIAYARLNKLVNGSSIEDVAIGEGELEQAQTSYDSSKRELERIDSITAEIVLQASETLNNYKSNAYSDLTSQEQTIQQAEISLENTKKTYQKGVDNALINLVVSMNNKISLATSALDYVDRIINNDNYISNFNAKDSSRLINAKSEYELSDVALSDTKNLSASVDTNSNSTEVSALYILVSNLLNKTFSTLNLSYSVLENSIISSALSQTSLDGFKTSIDTQNASISSAIASLQSTKQALDSAVLSYDSNLATAQENLNKAQVGLTDSIRNAENALVNAELSRKQQLTLAESKVEASLMSLQSAQLRLKRTTAPARNEDISLYNAQVKQAQANLKLTDNQISNNIIKSSMEGVVGKINFEIGEQVNPGQPVVSLLTDNNFEVELDVSETDISKIKINDPAVIVLDALGESKKFVGKVFFVEPAETIIQGVIYYKVKIDFEIDGISKSSASIDNSLEYDVDLYEFSSIDNDMSDSIDLDMIKSGMTASVEITTNTKEDVLVVPMRAVIEKDGRKIVKILEGEVSNEVKEVVVELGLIGDGGLVEVISGINEGERVITFIKEKK